MKKEMLPSDLRYIFLLGGLIFGIQANMLSSLLFTTELTLYSLGAYIPSLITFIGIGWLFKSDKKLKFGRKFRLIFFGMSFASFLYALLDIYQFINGRGVAVVSIFSSIALGGLFSMVERFLDLREKKEL